MRTTDDLLVSYDPEATALVEERIDVPEGIVIFGGERAGIAGRGADVVQTVDLTSGRVAAMPIQLRDGSPVDAIIAVPLEDPNDGVWVPSFAPFELARWIDGERRELVELVDDPTVVRPEALGRVGDAYAVGATRRWHRTADRRLGRPGSAGCRIPAGAARVHDPGVRPDGAGSPPRWRAVHGCDHHT